MKKLMLTIFNLLCMLYLSTAQEVDSVQMQIDQIEQSLNYQTGDIELESDNALLHVPKGFGYLNKEQSIYVLTTLWGNPADSSILGLLVPENKGVMASNSWVFTISYNEMGYVKDDDPEDIDYDDLFEEMQKEFKENNPEREKLGYPPIELVAWASPPHYDKSKKILHWAKELKFGDDSINTLNYNLRVLGRKGVFMLNAVAGMQELPEVKLNIDKVIASVEFKDGHKYSDFVPDVDNVAAWTIGGLVAGKVLAKVGFFVLLAKFWKLIVIAFAAAGSYVWKFFKRKKEEKNETPQKQIEPPSQNNEEAI
jgi:uncharacterized membrane-anchored protein